MFLPLCKGSDPVRQGREVPVTKRYRIAEAALLVGAVVAPAVLAAGGPRAPFYPSIAVHAGRLYTQLDHGAYVAVDLPAGSVAWRFRDPRLRVFLKPAFYGRAVVLAATVPPGSDIMRITDGKVDWRVHYEHICRNLAPVVCGERVLVGVCYQGKDRDLDIASGKTIWTRGGGAEELGHPPAVHDGQAFYVARRDLDSVNAAHPPWSWAISEVDCTTGAVSDNIGLEEGMWASNFSISLRDGRAILVGSESHIGTDVGLFDLSKRALLWRLHLDHVHVSWNEPVLEGDDLVLSEDGLWVISLSKGVVRFHRDNPFLGVAPALVKGTLIFQTGSNKLTAVDVGSDRVRLGPFRRLCLRPCERRWPPSDQSGGWQGSELVLAW
jgi:outer membrane protein assembly factor BamB